MGGGGWGFPSNAPQRHGSGGCKPAHAAPRAAPDRPPTFLVQRSWLSTSVCAAMWLMTWQRGGACGGAGRVVAQPTNTRPEPPRRRAGAGGRMGECMTGCMGRPRLGILAKRAPHPTPPHPTQISPPSHLWQVDCIKQVLGAGHAGGAAGQAPRKRQQRLAVACVVALACVLQRRKGGRRGRRGEPVLDLGLWFPAVSTGSEAEAARRVHAPGRRAFVAAFL